jgi:hypothetical protein
MAIPDVYAAQIQGQKRSSLCPSVLGELDQPAPNAFVEL